VQSVIRHNSPKPATFGLGSALAKIRNWRKSKALWKTAILLLLFLA
jgi:hypothetical protein